MQISHCAAAYFNVGNAYINGIGVERDVKKAKHYWQGTILAALRGWKATRREQ